MDYLTHLVRYGLPIELTDIPSENAQPRPHYLRFSEPEKYINENFDRITIFGRPIDEILLKGMDKVRDVCELSIASFNEEPARYHPLYHITNFDREFTIHGIAFSNILQCAEWRALNIKIAADHPSSPGLVNVGPGYPNSLSYERMPELLPHTKWRKGEPLPEIIPGIRLYVSGQFRGEDYRGARLLIELIVPPPKGLDKFHVVPYRIFNSLWQLPADAVRRLAYWSGVANMRPPTKPVIIYHRIRDFLLA